MLHDPHMGSELFCPSAPCEPHVGHSAHMSRVDMGPGYRAQAEAWVYFLFFSLTLDLDKCSVQTLNGTHVLVDV